MESAIWILLPVLVAAGSALISYNIMNARLELAVSRERESHASTQAKLRALEECVPDKISTAQEVAKRKAFDEFLLDFRVEERRYLRESKSNLLNRRALVTQERLYFRNIPLSNWVEQELPIEEDASLTMIERRSVFTAKSIGDIATMQSAPQYLA